MPVSSSLDLTADVDIGKKLDFFMARQADYYLDQSLDYISL